MVNILSITEVINSMLFITKLVNFLFITQKVHYPSGEYPFMTRVANILFSHPEINILFVTQMVNNLLITYGG